MDAAAAAPFKADAAATTASTTAECAHTRLVFEAQPLVVAVFRTQQRWLLKEQASSLHYYIEECYIEGHPRHDDAVKFKHITLPSLGSAHVTHTHEVPSLEKIQRDECELHGQSMRDDDAVQYSLSPSQEVDEANYILTR